MASTPTGPIQPNTLSHLRADVPGLHLRPANKLEAMILGAGCRRRRRGGLGSGKGCLPSCWQRMYPGTYRASLSSLHSPTNVYTSLSSLRYCRILSSPVERLKSNDSSSPQYEEKLPSPLFLSVTDTKLPIFLESKRTAPWLSPQRLTHQR